MNGASKYIEPICYNCSYRSEFVCGSKGIQCNYDLKYIHSLYATCENYRNKHETCTKDTK